MTTSSVPTMPLTQFLLSVDDVPSHWYNILADLPFSVPLERRARAEAGARTHGQKLVPQLPLSMYRTSISREPSIGIPEPVRDDYRGWQRPRGDPQHEPPPRSRPDGA